jgi:hypothetical protein
LLRVVGLPISFLDRGIHFLGNPFPR